MGRATDGVWHRKRAALVDRRRSLGRVARAPVQSPRSASNAPNCVMTTGPKGNRHRTRVDNRPVSCAVPFVDFSNSKNLILVCGAFGRFPLGLSSSVRLAMLLAFVHQSSAKRSNVPGVEFRERQSL